MSKALIDAITEMREGDAITAADQLLAGGADPVTVLDACRDAMAIIGQRFEEGDCFIPELIMAGEILGQISSRMKPILQARGAAPAKLGKVVIGTVEGDIHDIGKDIVAFMLDVNGFEVANLGVNVGADAFVDAVKEYKAQVVALSGFLTLAYEPMKQTVDALAAAGMRDKVKIMIGGGQIDEQIRRFTGADAFGRDAVAAVSLAKGFLGV